MTPDELRTHPIFEKLTANQKTFVNELLSNGNDKIAAAHKAWKCSGDESARTLANRALSHDGISFLVESYFGKDPDRLQFTKESALDWAAKQARAAGDPKVALDYFKLIVAMNGWLYKPAEAKPPSVDTPRDDSNDEFSL